MVEDLVIKVYIDKTPSGTHIKILGNSSIIGDSSLGFFEFITDFSKRIESVGFLLLGLFFIIAGACLEYSFLGAIISFIGMAMLVYAVVPRKSERK